jgi:uncharacterized protein DUF4394/Calx-beta domain-containing protein
MLEGLDVRPQTGQLYALGSTSRLYRIDPADGEATQVGSGVFAPLLSGADFGFDFSPVADRARVVSDLKQNLRVNPATAAVTTDALLNPGTPVVTASGYTNSFPGAAATTLYGIDTGATPQLVRQGGVDGSPSPDTGTVTPIPGLGLLAVGQSANLDLTPFESVAIATMKVASTQLYTVNTTSGVAILIGPIVGNPDLNGLAIASPGAMEFASAAPAAVESGSNATITVHRVGGAAGPTAIDYATANGSATAGSDYTVVSGTLVFRDGETSKTFTIPLLDDALVEGGETVALALTGGRAVGGAVGSVGAATLTIADDEPGAAGGGGSGGSGSGGSGSGSGAGQGGNVAPVLSAVTLTNRVFAPDLAARATARRRRPAPRGTRFRYRLSETAIVAVAIQRALPGRRVGRRCLAPSRARRRRPACTRFLGRGQFAVAGRAGANSTRFSGRLRGHALVPGRYRAVVVAADSGGLTSAVRTVTFQVVAR